MEVNINEVVGFQRMLVCPFDDAHILRADRFNQHVYKCRKSHQDKDFVSCPYNGTHHVLRHNLRQHIASCKDRQPIDQDVYNGCDETGEGKRQMGNVSLPENRQIIDHYSEDWDNDDDRLSNKESSVNQQQPRGPTS